MVLFIIASLILWAGTYGLSRVQHASKMYFVVWLGLTYLGYLFSALAWRRRLPKPKRRRLESGFDTEFTERNPPAKLPPARPG